MLFKNRNQMVVWFGLHPDSVKISYLCVCVYLCMCVCTLYLSAAAGLSLLCTELGPQVLPFFLIPFFTSSNSSGLKRVLRPHVRLLSSWVTVKTVTTRVTTDSNNCSKLLSTLSGNLVYTSVRLLKRYYAICKIPVVIFLQCLFFLLTMQSSRVI